jgi:hypothetical protein
MQIGQTAIEAYLTAFQTADFDPLPIVASAFVSYENNSMSHMLTTNAAHRRSILCILHLAANGYPAML